MRIIFLIALLFTASCEPPFVTASEEGEPFIVKEFEFKYSDIPQVVSVSKSFARSHHMIVKTSTARGFAILIEDKSISIFGDNSTRGSRLFVNAWKRSSNEKPSAEEEALAEKYFRVLGSILPESHR